MFNSFNEVAFSLIQEKYLQEFTISKGFFVLYTRTI